MTSLIASKIKRKWSELYIPTFHKTDTKSVLKMLLFTNSLKQLVRLNMLKHLQIISENM